MELDFIYLERLNIQKKMIIEFIQYKFRILMFERDRSFKTINCPVPFSFSFIF